MRKAVAVLLVAAALAGCAGQRREAPPVVYRSASPAELLACYNAGAAAINTLAADITMTFFYPKNGRTGRQRVTASLYIEKPGRLRLRHSALGPELFYIVSDGERFWIGLDEALAGESDVVYTGGFADLSGESFLRPDRLLAAFSLSPLPPAGASETLLEAYTDRYVLVFAGGSPLRVISRATFSREDLRLSRYETFDEESRLTLAVDYRAYRELAAAAVPETLQITWPQDGFVILARVSDVALNMELPPRLWEFNPRWRPNADIVDLGPRPTFVSDEPAPAPQAPAAP